MDSDSLITLVLFIAFFVLPSVFKQIKKRKQTKVPQKQSKISFFRKIGDQIRQYLEELEKQAQRQKSTAPQEESFWDALEEEGEEDEDKTWATDAPAYEMRQPSPATEPFPEPLKHNAQKAKKPPMPVIQKPMMDRAQRSVMSLKFRKNALQNAVVLTEIFSKPVAFKGWDR